VIRYQRTQDVRAIYDAVQSITDPVMWGLFLTLTVRHEKGHSLKETLGTLTSAWRSMQQSAAWREGETSRWEVVEVFDRSGQRRRVRRSAERKPSMRERFGGLFGLVRATEVTVRDSWHPHIHVWLVTRRRLLGAELADLENDLLDLWVDHVEKASADRNHTPNEHGVKIDRVTGSGVAAYLTKLQDGGEGLALEVTRGDLKNGRLRSRVPFELLDNPSNDADRARWIEYTKAMHGRHIIDVSPSLREVAALAERSDEEIIRDAHAETVAFWIDAYTYEEGRRRAGWLSEVLDATEADPAAAALFYGSEAG